MQKYLNTLTLGLTAGLLSTGVSMAEEEEIDFATQIYPFIKESCARCHRPSYTDERGRTRRPKADLIVTNKEALLEGGETQQEGETGVGGATGAIVPGEPDKSEFVIRVELPLTDDDHQPPEGKAPQWTTAEKELFRKWVEQGADFGDWTEDPNPTVDPVEDWDGEEYPDDYVRTAE